MFTQTCIHTWRSHSFHFPPFIFPLPPPLLRHVSSSFFCPHPLFSLSSVLWCFHTCMHIWWSCVIRIKIFRVCVCVCVCVCACECVCGRRRDACVGLRVCVRVCARVWMGYVLHFGGKHMEKRTSRHLHTHANMLTHVYSRMDESCYTLEGIIW